MLIEMFAKTLVAAGLCLPLAFACSGSESDSSGGTGWGCVLDTEADGGTQCRCSSPRPPGKSVDPSECQSGLVGPYQCCAFGENSCRCSDDPTCADNAVRVYSCDLPTGCPSHPANEGESCKADPATYCAGAITDSYCLDFSCRCVDGKFECNPGICS